MHLNPINLAIPLYIGGIAVEAGIDRGLGRRLYSLPDTLTNLACGLYQELMVVLAAGVLSFPYRWVYEHARLSDVPAAHPVATWLFTFVASDFLYYCFHRWSHEAGIGWFSHVVHHQSEEYNLSVALRQDAWQPFFSLWFLLPLAFLGVPPATFATAYGLVIVYQFWIHTRLVGKLGPLEWVFNTPSHHRVHHGVDPAYLDKNYAGVFIVWDRLLGTFEPERQAPTYGTIEPAATWNPAWAHWVYAAKLGARLGTVRGAWDKLQVLLRSPVWVPAGVAPMDVAAAATARLGAPKYDVKPPAKRVRFIVVTFALAMFTGLPPLLPSGVPWPVAAALALVAVWGLANVGGLLEARAWAHRSESARLVVIALAGAAGAALTHRAPWVLVPVIAKLMHDWLRATRSA